MRYVFFFAHPDDESVACAHTIYELTKAGNQVSVISVTSGQAGEIHTRVTEQLKAAGSVAELRKQEFETACQMLGVDHCAVLDFEDGEINNKDTWGKLEQAAVDAIDEYKPDVVVTFDHTGWYFHLDHVAVSIAMTRAFRQSIHRPQTLLHTMIKMEQSQKWMYDFPRLDPTHQVKVTDVEFKKQVLLAHGSQNLNHPLEWLEKPDRQFEWYRLVEGEIEEELFEKVE